MRVRLFGVENPNGFFGSYFFRRARKTILASAWRLAMNFDVTPFRFAESLDEGRVTLLRRIRVCVRRVTLKGFFLCFNSGNCSYFRCPVRHRLYFPSYLTW